MIDEILEPGAQLMESIRAVGYSLPAALADIVDNSIAASASFVDIDFSAESEESYVAVLDDGVGMHPDVARRAMQLAGVSSLVGRNPSDLGRFGLGLKTASLSQCRRLTLVTKQDDAITALVWDLDHMIETNKWSLGVLTAAEIAKLPGISRISEMPSGTLILWTKLDHLFDGDADQSRLLDERMTESRAHLGLVFHRFLSGDAGTDRLIIRINSNAIEAADPFLAKSPRTQVSPKETIQVAGAKIDVQAFTLPFLNKMTAAEKKRALVSGSLRDSQGFYVYRSGRLVIWGSWFRLMPRTELGKLARVRVDIPNSLDHLWALDIMKSTATPPPVVRERLRSLAARLIEPSQLVHNYRGRVTGRDDSLVRGWVLVEDRDSFRYEINRAHPLVADFANSLKSDERSQFFDVVEILQSTFPSNDMYNRMANDNTSEQDGLDQVSLFDFLERLWKSTGAPIGAAPAFVESMTRIEPFSSIREAPQALVDKLSSRAQLKGGDHDRS